MRWFWSLVRPSYLLARAERELEAGSSALGEERWLVAHDHLRTAWRDLEAIGGRQIPLLSASLSGLSAALLRLGRPAEAAEASMRMLGVVELAYGVGSPHVLPALDFAVMILSQTGRVRAAIVYQERLVRAVGDEQKDAAYERLEQLYDLRGHYDEALAVAEQRLAVRGLDGEALAARWNRVGIVRLRLERFAEAQTAFEHAWELGSSQAAPADYRTAAFDASAWAYARNLAAAHVGRGRVELAREWLGRAEGLTEEPFARALIAQTRGEAEHRAGNLATARTLLESAYATLSTEPALAHQLLRAKLALAALDHVEGKLASARAHAQDVLHELAPLEAPQHPLAVRARAFT